MLKQNENLNNLLKDKDKSFQENLNNFKRENLKLIEVIQNLKGTLDITNEKNLNMQIIIVMISAENERLINNLKKVSNLENDEEFDEENKRKEKSKKSAFSQRDEVNDKIRKLIEEVEIWKRKFNEKNAHCEQLIELLKEKDSILNENQNKMIILVNEIQKLTAILK